MSGTTVLDSSIGEFRVASGSKISAVVAKPVYRKISFKRITIKDDSEWFTHAEFIFHAIVDGKSVGRSEVKYANSGDVESYKYSMAIKHSPVDEEGDPKPLIVEFRVDELERIFPNEQLARFRAEFDKDDVFGIGDQSFENEYVKVDYVIEELTEDEFKDFEFVEGTIKNAAGHPIEDVWVKIYDVDSNELVKAVKTDKQGKYEVQGLTVDQKYRMDVYAKGYVYYSHTFEEIHQKIDIALATKLCFNGKVVDDDNKSVKGVRVDLYKTMVKAITKRNCFKEADTKSKIIGEIEPGDYLVAGTKIKKGTDADYVKIKSDKLETGEGWICSRWQKRELKEDKHEALLYDEKIEENITKTKSDGTFSAEFKEDYEGYEDQLYKVRVVLEDYFDGESERIDLREKEDDVVIEMEHCEGILSESELIKLLSHFKDYSYGDPVYPYSLKGVTKKTTLEGSGQYLLKDDFPELSLAINCCTFVEALLVKAHENSDASFEWSDKLHKKMMISDVRNDKFSPITAAKDEKMGDEIDKDKLPPAWTIVQGWQDDPNRKNAAGYVYPVVPDDLPGGHTFLIIDVHQETERVLTLEANKSYGLKGVGFRKLGDFKNKFTDCNPDKDWWKEAKLWDWTKFKSSYPCRSMARLRVYDLKWVK